MPELLTYLVLVVAFLLVLGTIGAIIAGILYFFTKND